MQEYSFRLAREEDRPAIISFMNTQWQQRHPLVNLPAFFEYYYAAGDGRLNFALAEKGGRLCALAGFVPSNIRIRPDIWVSLWVADKAARGVGLELMAALPGLTGCRSLSCNNIRPETRLFYEFLGFSTGRMGHFYRLAEREEYTLARLETVEIPPVSGTAQLAAYSDEEALLASGFLPPPNANPYKDLWYITRRYFHYPHQRYKVYGVVPAGESVPRALLCTRLIHAEGATVLRIADFIGPPALLPNAGRAINSLMEGFGAEYADFYCAGIDPQLLYRAGFCERRQGEANILPNYLNPPLYQNTDYYYFTNQPEGFVMCKADGDQDRPNLPVPQEG